MTTSLGMSTGAAGVGSALVTIHPNGAYSTEFRYLSADRTHHDLGDLVRSSISLMTTQVPAKPSTPDAFAVTYRTPVQAHSIRTAVQRQRHRVHLVPETAATLAYLRHTGTVAQHAVIAVVDLGESGLSVSVVDQVDGTVIHADRTNRVSGKEIDTLLLEHASSQLPTSRPLRHLDRDLLSERFRVAKEQLSFETNVHVDIGLRGIRSIGITRVTFDTLSAPMIRAAVEFIRSTTAESSRQPDALALVGGGANIPALGVAVTRAFSTPVVTVREPDTVTARGAALLAVSAAIGTYPATESDRPKSATKVSGAIIGAFVVGGLVLGYGVREFVPERESTVSPAGSDRYQTTEPTATDAAETADVLGPPPESTPTSENTLVPLTSTAEVQAPLISVPEWTSETTTARSTTPVGATTLSPSPAQPDQPKLERPTIPSLSPQVPEVSTAPTESAEPTATVTPKDPTQPRTQPRNRSETPLNTETPLHTETAPNTAISEEPLSRTPG